MNSDYNSEMCFLCNSKPVNPQWPPDSEADSKANIHRIICMHFWFQEHDLVDALVCEVCCDKVNQFHRFYQEVRELHERWKIQEPPPLVVIKQEQELDIEDEYPIEETEENAATVEDAQLEVAAIKTEEASEETVNQKDQKSEDQKSGHEKPHRFRRTLKTRSRKAEDDVIQRHTKYTCEDCDGLQFDSFCTAIRHRIRSHRQASVKCCGRQYSTRAKLYRHALNPGPFKCDQCTRVFKFFTGYLRHKKDQHTDESELIFKCQHCPESFAQEEKLKRHLEDNHEPKKCEACGKQFRNRIGLTRHTVAVHRDPNNYICQICSKGFYRRKVFMEHQKTHELTPDELKEQCNICGKWLKNHSTWLKHVQWHQYKGQHQCDQCDYVSDNLLSLKAHKRRRHGTEKKEHRCEFCGKAFALALSLKEHVASAHTGEPLYKCQYCENEFFCNSAMYAHRKKDHPREWLQNHASQSRRKARPPVIVEVEASPPFKLPMRPSDE
nr:zinc finger protein 569-like [Aedes albopictus]